MRDRFGRRHVYLRVAVTGRCNLECAYCRPSAAPAAPPRPLGTPEILRLVRVFASLGICKVRLTGGEPTLRPGLLDLAAGIAALPGVETLALTTNGVSLEGLAAPLRRAGVRLLNVSLDSLRRERYAAITGKDLLPAVLRGLDGALGAGFVPLKLNAVVIRGVNDDELLDFVDLARERPVNVRFIEFMPFRDNGWDRSRLVPHSEMRARVEEAHHLIPLGRGERTGGVAQDFSIWGSRGFVSFITPISESFCSRCNRLRLTADGRLKTCLFAPAGVDLAGAAAEGATDDRLRQLIVEALSSKPESHGRAEDLVRGQDLAMHEIGG